MGNLELYSMAEIGEGEKFLGEPPMEPVEPTKEVGKTNQAGRLDFLLRGAIV